MSGQVVVNTAVCDLGPGQVRCKYGLRFGECDGCLGNGTRALLDTAIEVERDAAVLPDKDGFFTRQDVWVEVER